MIQLMSFMQDGVIPSYSQVWRRALEKLYSVIGYNMDTDYPPADDEGDDFNAALDNLIWLRNMAYAGDDLDLQAYRQWWVDFIICQLRGLYDLTQTNNIVFGFETMAYPEGGCDGDIRFAYIIEDLL